MKCTVCFDIFQNLNEGICCESGTAHFICNKDFSQYLSENALPQIFKLRQNRGNVMCPCADCGASYDPIEMLEKMGPRERIRYIGVLNEIAVSNNSGSNNNATSSSLQSLQSAIFDILTLKCTSCKTPVDPFPDACSAVMCLNCGNHYCNVCFTAFTDRGDAHRHAATHSQSSIAESRDSFLPAEIVSEGQRQYRIQQLERFILLTLTSYDLKNDWRGCIRMALVLTSTELIDLKIDPVELWRSVVDKLKLSVYANAKDSTHKQHSMSRSLDNDKVIHRRLNSSDSQINSNFAKNNRLVNDHEDEDDYDEGTEFDDEFSLGKSATDTSGPNVSSSITTNKLNLLPSDNTASIYHTTSTTAAPSTTIANSTNVSTVHFTVSTASESSSISTARQGAIQLCNALLSRNHEAAIQIINAYKSDIDINYIEPIHHCPMASLAVLSQEIEVAKHLFTLGVDVRLRNKEGRSSLYVVLEYGLEAVLECIVNSHTNQLQQQQARIQNQQHQMQQQQQPNFNSSSQSSMNKHPSIQTSVSTTNIESDSDGCIATEQQPLRLLQLHQQWLKQLLNEPVTDEFQAYTPIHVATRYGHGHLIAWLVAHGCDVNTQEQEHGYTALSLALVLGDEWCARELLLCGAVEDDSNNDSARNYTDVVVDGYNCTTINSSDNNNSSNGSSVSNIIGIVDKTSINTSNTDKIKSTATTTATTTTTTTTTTKCDLTIGAYNGRTPLFIAAERGMTSFIQLAVKLHLININTPLYTPTCMYLLHIAVCHQQSHVVASLLAEYSNNGDTNNANNNSTSNTVSTSKIDSQEQQQQQEAALSNTIKTSSSISSSSSSLSSTSTITIDLNVIEELYGYTPLLMAIARDDTTSALLLIQDGCDVNIPSKNQRLPIYLAIERGNVAVVKALIKSNKININASSVVENSNNTTVSSARKYSLPLEIALLHIDQNSTAQYQIISLLLQHGANVNLCTGSDFSPLVLAILAKNEYCVRLLLQYGANVNFTDITGKPALYYACERNCTGISRLLMQHCMKRNINSTNQKSYTNLSDNNTNNNNNNIKSTNICGSNNVSSTADVAAINNSGTATVFDINASIVYGPPFSRQTTVFLTCLHVAVMFKSTAVLCQLLDYDDNFIASIDNSSNSLHNSSTEEVGMENNIIERRGSESENISETEKINMNASSPSSTAIKTTVPPLLNVNVKDHLGRTPYELAIELQNTAAQNILLSYVKKKGGKNGGETNNNI